MNSEPASLAQVARLFLRLGLTSFGGPAAHIASMHDEVVRRRKWVTDEEFLEMLATANLIPGPNSTELAIQIGSRRAGAAGLLVAGFCFITPAALIVGFLSWFYVQYGTLPQTMNAFYAVKPVVIAVIVKAMLDLGRTSIKSGALWIVAIGSGILNLAGLHELAVIFLAGFATWAPSRPRVAGALFLFATPNAGAFAGDAGSVFSYFLKVGAMLYGSGYVLVAILEGDLVHRLGWITQAQLLDAVALGQVTPGPLFTTATFIGYILAGFWGAVAATAGIFLPSFVFVAAIQPIMRRVRASSSMRPFLDGISAASIALMFVVAWKLSDAAIVDYTTATIALSSGLLVAFFNVPTTWTIVGAVVLGLLIGLLI